MLDSAAGGRVRESIERDSEELAELALSLSALPDLSGDEVAVAEAVAAWFRAAGIDATLQPLTPTSANVIARIGPDDGSVPTLMLSSHLDTEGSLPEGDEAERRRLRGAWREGDLLVGKGLVNDKTQLAAMLVAIRAVHRLGRPLAGGLLFLGTAQECGAPVQVPERLGPRRGPAHGRGIGSPLGDGQRRPRFLRARRGANRLRDLRGPGRLRAGSGDGSRVHPVHAVPGARR